MRRDSKKAVLAVDIQNDFCPGGALSVPGGDKVIPLLNKYIGIFSKHRLPVFITRDWHPKKTSHFRRYGGVWPVHCVRGSEGAKLHPKFKFPKDAILLSKGMDPTKDSYSVFQATDRKGRAFIDILRELCIDDLYIGGLAADYCVKYTSLDALKHGFKVNILTDAIRGVDLKAGDSKKAIALALKRGAKKTTLRRLRGRFR